jgi:hypothetical protein
MISALALVLGCASLKDNDFLLKNLDDANKAIALTNQGITAYNRDLIEQSAYNKAADVRQYFVVALRYDPDNPKAKQYLDKVDNFKTSLARDKINAADKLLAKPKRTDDENYAIIAALQTAVAIDPSNDAASKLLRENAPVQSSLIDNYIARSKDAQTKAADPALTDSAREVLYIQSYDAVAKASAISPANAIASKQKASIKAELEKRFTAHNAAVAKLTAKAKFDDAKGELGRANAINSKLERVHDDDVALSTYSLYFKWAKALDAKGSFQDANDKLDLAIAAKRSDEALVLKTKLDSKTVLANKDASFDNALPEIDKYLDKGDLLGANKRIVAAARLTKDKSKLDQLDTRRAKIEAGLGDLYNNGVSAYRSENFKTAIEQLSVVVNIDAEYEQASDYLDKAKEKQKLLEQFSN